MNITAKPYGTLPDGREVTEYILDNGYIRAHIINYGGIVTKLFVGDTDVVLGRASLEEYLDNDGYIGAVIGRFANRIAGAKFTLDGTEYNVGRNEGNNSLHGGLEGFDKKLWSATVDNDALILETVSPDSEEGFPGTLNLCVKYSITPENGLKIEYSAVSDKDTVCNLTNHSYFNLNGYNSGKIYNHKMTMQSRFFTPNNSECMPTGEVLKTEGTPFDFTQGRLLGEAINSDFEQAVMFGGIDHNFALDGTGFRKVLEASGDISGITMEMYTNQPAVQVYTSNALGTGVNKGDYENTPHDAFCLETQVFPDCVNNSHFPQAVLRKGERYNHITEYRFYHKL